MSESHVENEVRARIARVRAEEERKRRQREELAAARAKGVAKRHARHLYNLAEHGLDLAPVYNSDNTTLAASGAL
jgi:DNA invertase Pin-like site-specific DNA recombinase